MRYSTSQYARHAATFLLLAGVFAACGPCDDGGEDGSGGGLTGTGGNTPSSGTLTGGDGGSGSTQGITVQGSTGTTCPGATTCEAENAKCGNIPDNCGNVLDCGECGAGESCSAGECVVTECTPITCADLGPNACGQASDGCGGLTEDCGSCAQPEVCGGGEDPSQCAIPEYCTGLCLQQVDCPDPAVTTTITGIVYAPGRPNAPAPPMPGSPDPLFDALVYIPNGPVEAFEPNVQCSQCGEEASGSPLVSARTNAAGEFVLENVPVGADIPLVIQLGRWRRQVTIPAVSACVDNPVGQELTRLPRNKSEGDIPQIAISTGSVDSLECVLRKIGISDSEFTNPSGDGRVKLYRGIGSGGQRIDGTTPNEGVLLDSQAELNSYDMVLFPCQGDTYPNRATEARRQNLVSYTDAGGRIFTTHFSYDWMININGQAPHPFATVGDWQPNGGNRDTDLGIINQGFPKGATFAQWLVNVGASTVLGEMPVNVVRNDIDSVDDMVATEWMTSSNFNGNPPLHLTFNTPIGAPPEDQCGRALYSDFHIADASTGGTTFPNGCTGSAAVDVPMTPQEKLVEFMLFDLGSCLTPDDPVCVPKTCTDLNLECGPAPDGCNNIIQCGDCPDGEICGGGGPGQCGNSSCTPKTCPQQGKNCGQISDQCGDIIDCGECVGNQVCGAEVANVCGDNVPN